MNNVSDAVVRKTRKFFLDLISIPSTRGNEGPASLYVFDEMSPYVDTCRLVEIDDSIMQDPDYAFPLPGLTYKGRPNVECIIRGKGGGRSVVLNAHLDVVPPSENQIDPFVPRLMNGTVYGRGACDDKGPASSLYALAMLIHESGIKPNGDIIFHFVVEEENGGNGSLAMVRRGIEADGAIVMEGTDLSVYPAVRGAVWFELKVFGKAGHSGYVEGRVSAVDKAIQCIEIFQRYHDRILEESRDLPLFDQYLDPMPLTIGQFNAGNWPASVPAEATLKGLLGFLPNHTRHEIQNGLRNALLSEGDEWLQSNFDLSFPMLNSDGNSIPQSHPLVKNLLQAIRNNNITPEVKAMTAACDAWFYNNQANIPTVVFGPGKLSYAHSKDEQIELTDILKAASILMNFVDTYCR